MAGMYIAILVVLLLYDIACVSYYDTMMNFFWWLAGAYLHQLILDSDRGGVDYE